MQDVNWRPRGREELQRECDMRTDDAMKLCKEIDALNAKLEAIRDYGEFALRYSA